MRRLKFNKTLYPHQKGPRATILLVLFIAAFFTSLTSETKLSSAAVNSMRHNGDGTRTGWTTNSGGTTNLYTTIQEDPDSPSDANYIQTGCEQVEHFS